MASHGSHTVLIIGAAMVAGGFMDGAAFAQAPAAPPAAAPAAPAIPAPLYPGPGFPTCIVKAPTDCRMPNGHPDLTGLYVAGGPTGQAVFQNGLASGAQGITFAGRGDNFVGFEADGGLFRQTRDYGTPGVGLNQPATTNPPQYKPQYWDAIVEAEYNGNFEDPAQNCMPNGVPRMGAPAAIVAVPNQNFVILMQSLREIRVVPTDGRMHDALTVASETWNGDPVGHWEGDTLVVESIGFTDASWLAKSGFLHGFNMKVTEKLTRVGNNLTWSATVEDPDYLVAPWNITPVTRAVTLDPNANLVDVAPCQDIDHLHVTAHVRSG